MQFNLALLAIAVGLVAAPGTFASPAPAPAAEIVEARAADAAQSDGSVYVCTNSGFSGTCTNVAFNRNSCVNFPDGFQDNISSIRPPQGFVCYAYVNYFCKTDEAAFSIVYPGISDLSTTPYNDALSSVMCY